MIASLRASVERSPVGIARRALWTRLADPHTGAYVTARRLTDDAGVWDGSLLIGVLGEKGLLVQARAQSIERIVVTDAFDNILLDTAVRPSAADDALGGKFTAEVRNALTLHANGIDYFFARQTDPGTAVTVTVLAPQRLFWRFATTSLAALAVAAALMIVLARVVTRRRSRRSAQALASLDHAIGEWLGGRLEYRLAEPTFGEFAGIYQSFNQLIGELDAQITSNAALERSHTALEKRQLEMQFNPHFIFNTMEIVRYQIATDPAAASQIVLDLARLMRYSVRGLGTAVRLSEDLEYLTAYLDLHQRRMGDRLDCEVSCTPDAAEALVPRLLVQPLVENALAHARPPERDRPARARQRRGDRRRTDDLCRRQRPSPGPRPAAPDRGQPRGRRAARSTPGTVPRPPGGHAHLRTGRGVRSAPDLGRRRRHPGDGPTAPRGVRGGRTEMQRVLVVEDAEPIRKGLIFSTDWEAMGCVVVGEAANGAEGWSCSMPSPPTSSSPTSGCPASTGSPCSRPGRPAKATRRSS